MAGYTVAELVEISVKIEEQGQSFYSAAAETIEDKSAKEVLLQLAQDEKRHSRIFQSLLPNGTGVLPEEAAPYIKGLVETSVLKYLRASEDHLATDSPVQLLEFALGFEKETLLFYFSIREFMDRRGQTVLRKIIGEEESHVRRILEMISERQN